VLALIVVGLAAGWPLMVGSVAAEADDGYDAMSRAYAYVHQRPWHYLGYVAVAALAGAAGLWFVHLFARLVLYLTAWSLSFGAPESVAEALFLGLDARDTGLPPAALTLHGFWVSAVLLLARGWAFSYFWTVAAAVYLLLRRDVDGTPLGRVAYEGRPGLLVEAATAPRNPVSSETPGFCGPSGLEARVRPPAETGR
jgi:hypothetical protein